MRSTLWHSNAYVLAARLPNKFSTVALPKSLTTRDRVPWAKSGDAVAVAAAVF